MSLWFAKTKKETVKNPYRYLWGLYNGTNNRSLRDPPRCCVTAPELSLQNAVVWQCLPTWKMAQSVNEQEPHQMQKKQKCWICESQVSQLTSSHLAGDEDWSIRSPVWVTRLGHAMCESGRHIWQTGQNVGDFCFLFCFARRVRLVNLNLTVLEMSTGKGQCCCCCLPLSIILSRRNEMGGFLWQREPPYPC